MPKISPRKLKGFRDTTGTTIIKRKHILDAIDEEARLCAFAWIDTPCLEYAETLLGEGGETDKQVYGFLDNGKREVALRYDLTMPFARFLAENPAPQLPYRKVQVGKVWRAEKPQRGRFREFMQCDFDIVGKDHLFEDIEILNVLIRSLRKCDIGNFTLSIGHRRILTHLLEHICNITKKDIITKALIALDKLPKIGEEKVTAELVSLGTTDSQAKALLDILKQKDDAHNTIQETLLVTAKSAKNPNIAQDITRLFATLSQLQNLLKNTTQVTVRVDLSLARGLNYYSGMVFETTLDTLPHAGSICSGGRYDLSSHFSKPLPPCVGGSIGVDRLVACMEEMEAAKQNTHQSPHIPKQVFLVGILDDIEAIAGLQRVAQLLRNMNIATEYSLHTKKVGKQYQAAAKSGAFYALFAENATALADLDDEKLLQREVQSKHLATGEQHSTTLGEFVRSLAKNDKSQSLHTKL